MSEPCSIRQKCQQRWHKCSQKPTKCSKTLICWSFSTCRATTPNLIYSEHWSQSCGKDLNLLREEVMGAKRQHLRDGLEMSVLVREYGIVSDCYSRDEHIQQWHVIALVRQ